MREFIVGLGDLGVLLWIVSVGCWFSFYYLFDYHPNPKGFFFYCCWLVGWLVGLIFC